MAGEVIHNGTLYDANGVMQTIVVTAGAVPAGAEHHAGTAHSSIGERYCCEWPDDSEVTYIAGIAHSHDGAMVIAPDGAVATHVRGIGCTDRGEVVASVDTPDVFVAGMGLLHDGTLCVSSVEEEEEE